MAKKETTVNPPAGEAAGTVATPTQRERYRSRRKESHPDLSEDDEEGWYGQANADLDELEGYRESNKALSETFDRTPTLAGMLLAAKDGQNPFVYLAEQAGPDLDIRELANDPDFGEEMVAAIDKWQDAQKKSKENDQQILANYQQSLQTLKALAGERGMSDDDCMSLVVELFGDEEQGTNGIIGDICQGIVSKAVWESVLKAKNYDSDLAAAREKGGAQAMNERLQNPLKNFDDAGMPPNLTTGGAGAGESAPRRRRGGFASFGEELED